MELGSNSELSLASRREFGMVKEPLFIRLASWDEFYSAVHEYPHGDEQQTPLYEEDVRSSVKEYLSESQKNLYDESNKQLVEAKLTELCFHPVYYSTHYVMEDTSNGIKNWNSEDRKDVDDSSDFRKIVFTRLEDSAQRVDFTMRKHCSSEPTHYQWNHPISYPIKITKAKKSGYDVPSWRFNPLNIIAFIDIKKATENLDMHTTQTCYYCESVLRTTPTREYCFCALTNVVKVMFVAVRKIGTDFIWYKSDVSENKAAIENLAAFLATTPTSLGCVEFNFPHHLMSMEKPLGRGSTSWVVEGKLLNSGLSRAVKISCDSESLLVERQILSFLHSSLSEEFQCMIPTLDDVTLEALNPAFRDYVNVLMEVYDKKTDGFIRKRMMQLWKLLREVHQLGIVHCDIRTPNLRWNVKDKCLVLLDWSSSRAYVEIECLNEIPLQETTMITASTNVLSSITTLGSKNFNCYPNDEGVALIYCILQWYLPNQMEFNNPVATPQQVKNERTRFWASINLSKKKEVIESGEKLRGTIEEIEQLSDKTVSATLDDLVAQGIEQAHEFANKYKSVFKRT